MKNAEKAGKEGNNFPVISQNFPSLEANKMPKLFGSLWIAFWRQTWEKYKEFAFGADYAVFVSNFHGLLIFALAEKCEMRRGGFDEFSIKLVFTPQPHPRPRTNVLSLFRLTFFRRQKASKFHPSFNYLAGNKSPNENWGKTDFNWK